MSTASVRADLVLALLLQAGREFSSSPEGRVATSSGLVDWVLLALAAAGVVASIVLCAKYFLRPGESSEDHIKRRVLRDEVEPGDRA